ncbi:MAG: hypothetical protein ACLFUS_01590 [Candidatus Sumerlaeia bacterium]
MGIIIHPVFFAHELPQPPQPKGYEEDEKIKEDFEKSLAQREAAFAWAAENLIVARMQRLMEMKEAYETGGEWDGDSLVEGAEGNNNTMRLTFLEANQKGWHMPFNLPDELSSDKPRLWDAVNKLHDSWDLLKTIEEADVNYFQKLAEYRARLRDLGMNVNAMPNIQMTLGEMLPKMVRLLYARLIWSYKDEDEKVTVGLNKPLTYELLRDMFEANLENFHGLRNLNCQISSLEYLLSIARMHGVTEIQMVRLPQPQESFILEEVDRSEVTMDPSMRDPSMMDPSMMGGDGYQQPGMEGEFPPGMEDMDAEMYEMYGPEMMGPQASDPEKAIQETSVGHVSFIGLNMTCNNTALMRFLYTIAHNSHYFKTENVMVEKLPDSEEDLLLVRMDIMIPYVLADISSPYANIFSQYTMSPIPILEADKDPGQELWDKHMGKLRNAGLDIPKIVQTSFEEKGYKPTPTPKP